MWPNVDAFPVEKWDAIIAINLTSAFHTSRLVLPAHESATTGAASSISRRPTAWSASAGKSAYVAAKHGLLGLTKMKKPFYKVLYLQVLFAIIVGVLLGIFDPDLATAMKPLGDGFVKLIKMIIAPVIFCTVVAGIAGMQDIKKVGRVGGKALIYFEIVSTFALAIGLIVANLIKPGAGFNVNPATIDTASIAQYTSKTKSCRPSTS
jgi:hypothetical protein